MDVHLVVQLHDAKKAGRPRAWAAGLCVDRY